MFTIDLFEGAAGEVPYEELWIMTGSLIGYHKEPTKGVVGLQNALIIHVLVVFS